MSEQTRIAELLGHAFEEKALLEEALTHRSHAVMTRLCAVFTRRGSLGARLSRCCAARHVTMSACPLARCS